MADQERQSLQDNQSTQLLKGLITDSAKNNQPDGSWSYALNLVNETKQGDKGFVANEYGNRPCSKLTYDGVNYLVIGAINLIAEDVVLFLATSDKSESRIVIQSNCKIIPVVYSIGTNSASCLNFSEYHPITGIAKIRKGCNRVIYFRDSYNSDRSIDLDEILNTPDNNRYYNTTDGWNCSAFKLSPDFIFPTINYVNTSDAGGNLKLGVYQFGIALGDEDLNFSAVLDVTLPIPIIKGLLGGNSQLLQGGDPLKENSPTTKSITINITNLDLNYQYFKLYVIETIANVTTPYILDTFTLDSTSFNYTYTGLDYNSAIATTINDINTGVLVYDKSKTMEQQDQRFLRANLEEKTIDYASLQIAANKIKTRYVTTPRKYESNTSVFSGNYYVERKSYMRDEIYALGISAVFLDGTESAELHVPGRVLDTGWDYTVTPWTEFTLPDTDPSGQFGSKEHNRKPPILGQGWDSSEYVVIDCETTPKQTGPSYPSKTCDPTYADWTYPLNHGAHNDLATNEVSSEDAKPMGKVANGGIDENGKIKRWELYNTAYREYFAGFHDGEIFSKGQMAYWESTYEYPNTLSCNNERIYPEGKIRHHKMPDTTLEPHFFVDPIIFPTDVENSSFIVTLGIEFDLSDFIIELQTRLGSKYSEIQGFKISRVKRDKGNKSVLDKGISYRALEMEYDTTDNHAADRSKFILQNNFYNKHINVHRVSGSGFGNLETKSFCSVIFDEYDNVLPDFSSFSSGAAKDELALFRYSRQYMSIHNPKSQFYNETTFQYIKCEKELYGQREYFGDIYSWKKDKKSKVAYNVEYSNHYNVLGPLASHGTPMPYFTNRLKFDDYYQVANLNTTFDNRELIGKTQQDVYLAKIDYFPDISNEQNMFVNYGGAGGRDCDGSTINWTPGGDKINIGYKPGFSPQGECGLDVNISKAYYISLKNYSPSIYNQLSSLTYYPIHSGLLTPNTNNVILWGGDTFISKMQFRMTNTDVVTVADKEKSWFTMYTNFFVESEVNCKLRNEGYGVNDYPSWYFPIRSKQDVLFNNDINKIGASDVDGIIIGYLDGKYCFNTYNYNKDYSKEIGLKPKFPLALGFDYCSTCQNKFPYRIVFSEKSYQEDRTDSYRKFLPGSYRDISAATGEIMNLFRESDTLFIRTEQSLWTIPTKQQELKTDQTVIQLGTGDFFSLPPKELISTTIGYNGGQTTLDLVVNEYGAIYADANAGIVFLTKRGKYKEEQVEISKEGGMRFWFDQNLPFALLDFDPTFEHTDAPTGLTGIGLIGYYDPQYRRYILTKKDYYPYKSDIYDYVYFSAGNPQWTIYTKAPDGTPDVEVTTVLDPYNSEYFENRSWTISYSLEENVWLSWHSYLPNFAWNTRGNFFTTIRTNNNTWKHGDGEFQSFYGDKYPHVFEFVSTKDPLNTKIYNTLSYISNVQEYNTFNKQWKDIKDDTFNKGVFYNDTQSTGELDITVKNSSDPFASILLPFDAASILAERTESNWNINNFRDMVDQTSPEQPIFTSDWGSIKNNYFTDKIPNSNIINFLTKPQYEMEPMRDNYLAIRLSYKNALNNRRIITKYLSNNFNQSIR